MHHLFFLLLISRSSLDIFTNVHLGPIMFNIPSLMAFFLLGISLTYLILKGKIKIHKIAKYFMIWLCGLIPFVFISVYNFSGQGLIAFREWIRLFTIFMIFVWLYNFAKREDGIKYLRYLFLSLIIPVLIGYYQLITHSGLVFPGGIRRVHATFAHPNGFASYLTIFIALSWWMFSTTRRRFWLIIILLQIGCLVSTLSFTGFFMIAVIGFMLFLKVEVKTKGFQLFIFGVFMLILIFTPQFHIRMKDIKKIDIIEAIEDRKVVDSFTWRIVNWVDLISVWKAKPLFGYGLHTTEFVNPQKYYINGRAAGYSPHSDLVRYLVETGLTGLSLYLIFIFFTFFCLYKEYRRCKEPHLKYLLYILLSIFISWQIGGSVDHVITVTSYQFYFWAVLAIALRLNKEQETIALDGAQ